MRILFSLLLFISLTLNSGFSLAQQVPDSPFKVTPLLINEEVPDVSLKTTEGETVALRDLISEKPSVIIFYRGGWCPYCSRHLAELQQIEDDILDLGYQILAVSVDRPEMLKETLSKNELSYTLLSDSPADVLKAFGIAYVVDQQTVDRYKSIGLNLEANAGYDHHILPAPAVYLVGTDGIVDFNYVNPDYKQRIDGSVLMAAAKAYMEP